MLRADLGIENVRAGLLSLESEGCRVLVSWTVSMTHRHWPPRTQASPWAKAAAIDHAAQPPR